MVLQITVHKVFSHPMWGLERFEDGNSIPRNLPAIFRPSPIATILQKFLLWFCVPLFQQCHLSENDEALIHNDSRIILHRVCQIPGNWHCQWLLAFQPARRTFVSSFLFPEKFCFHTGMIVSIEMQILYHDCVSVIVSRFTSFTENFVIYCYQVIKVFRSMCCITSAFPSRSPLWSWFSCILRNFGLLGSEQRYGGSTIRLFLEVPKLTHEKCLLVSPLMLTLFRPQDFLWNPTTIPANRETSFPVPDRCPNYHLSVARNRATGLPVPAGTSTSYGRWTWRGIFCFVQR